MLPLVSNAHKPLTVRRRLLAATISTSLLLVLSGCVTSPLQSTVILPGQFTSAPAAEVELEVEPEVAWWEGYGDPVLTELLGSAARENRDIRIAAERVRAARAGTTINRSALLPSFGATASAITQNNDFDAIAQRGAPEMKGTSAGLSVSWEVDLTGRLRAGANAAAADAQASADLARGVRLLVLTDVASNYFTLSGALRQLDTVQAIAAAQEETLRLVTARARAGLASPFDVERARTEASRALAAIPPLETLVAVSRHRLGVLIGSQPATLVALRPSTELLNVMDVRPGQPASLLERRPDLLAFRSQLEAANLRREQAAAEWFPQLFVSALFGSENLNVNTLDIGSARFGNVATVLSMPVFNWGRTRAINEIAESAQLEAVLRYEDAIVRALEDVENSLAALRDERERATIMSSATASADAALSHAQSLYERGQIDLLPLLDAQRARLVVQVTANASQTQLLLNSVQLYKALGGGWQAFEPATSVAASASAL